MKKRTSLSALTRIICKTISKLVHDIGCYFSSMYPDVLCTVGWPIQMLKKAMNAVANLIDLVGFPPSVNQEVGVSLLICPTLSPPRTSL